MIRSHESSVLKTFDIVFPYFPEITHEALPSYKIDEIKIMIYSTQPIIHDEKKINFLGIRQALLPLARRSSSIRKISSNFFHLTGRKIVERAVDLLKLKRINGAFLFALHEPYIQDSLNHYYKLDPNISLDMQILINPFVFQKKHIRPIIERVGKPSDFIYRHLDLKERTVSNKSSYCGFIGF